MYETTVVQQIALNLSRAPYGWGWNRDGSKNREHRALLARAIRCARNVNRDDARTLRSAVSVQLAFSRMA